MDIKELNEKYTITKGKTFEKNRSYLYLDNDGIEKIITCKDISDEQKKCIDDENNYVTNKSDVWKVPSTFKIFKSLKKKFFGGSNCKSRKSRNRKRTRNQTKRKKNNHTK